MKIILMIIALLITSFSLSAKELTTQDVKNIVNKEVQKAIQNERTRVKDKMFVCENIIKETDAKKYVSAFIKCLN